MAKIIIIDACEQCPYYEKGWCSNFVCPVEYVQDDNIIPDECTLEDAPEDDPAEWKPAPGSATTFGPDAPEGD